MVFGNMSILGIINVYESMKFDVQHFTFGLYLVGLVKFLVQINILTYLCFWAG